MASIHVIIPCYNAEQYLEKAVYSVLTQPYKEIDIILVDDGSPGETPALCDAVAAREPRVHVIHKPNGGVSSARNAGIDYALRSQTAAPPPRTLPSWMLMIAGNPISCPGRQ